MGTKNNYKILKRATKDSGTVWLEKIPTPTPKYATVEQLNEVKQEVNEVKQDVNVLRNEVNAKFDKLDAKLDLILQKK